MRVPHKAAALGAAGVIAIGAVAVPALAQDEGETTTEQEGQQAADDLAPDIEDRRSELTSRLAEALAAELELPVEEVEAALDAVHEQFRDDRRERRLAALEERLDGAVDEGSLTQEQADAILEAAEEGVLPRLLRHRGPGHSRGPGGPGASGGA